MGEEKKKECPFRKDLACEDCRLFLKVSKSHPPQCVFLLMMGLLRDIELFGYKGKE